MLFLLFILIGTVAATYTYDYNCTEMDTSGQFPGLYVFTPSATACSDNLEDTFACDQLFNYGSANTALPEPGLPVTPNRVVGCYQTAYPYNSPSADIKRVAVTFCPKYCGFCCETPAFKCANAPAPRINCDAVNEAMCNSTAWRQLIAEDCPRACGFCGMDGCVDIAPDCALQPTICTNPLLADFANSICKRTCNLCPKK